MFWILISTWRGNHPTLYEQNWLDSHLQMFLTVFTCNPPRGTSVAALIWKEWEAYSSRTYPATARHVRNTATDWILDRYEPSYCGNGTNGPWSYWKELFQGKDRTKTGTITPKKLRQHTLAALVRLESPNPNPDQWSGTRNVPFHQPPCHLFGRTDLLANLKSPKKSHQKYLFIRGRADLA